MGPSPSSRACNTVMASSTDWMPCRTGDVPGVSLGSGGSGVAVTSILYPLRELTRSAGNEVACGGMLLTAVPLTDGDVGVGGESTTGPAARAAGRRSGSCGQLTSPGLPVLRDRVSGPYPSQRPRRPGQRPTGSSRPWRLTPRRRGRAAIRRRGRARRSAGAPHRPPGTGCGTGGPMRAAGEGPSLRDRWSAPVTNHQHRPPVAPRSGQPRGSGTSTSLRRTPPACRSHASLTSRSDTASKSTRTLPSATLWVSSR